MLIPQFCVNHSPPHANVAQRNARRRSRLVLLAACGIASLAACDGTLGSAADDASGARNAAGSSASTDTAGSVTEQVAELRIRNRRGTAGSTAAVGGAGTGASSVGGQGGASSCAAGVELTVDDEALGTGLNQLSFSANWSTSTGTGKYGVGDHYSSTSAASVKLTFQGTSVAVYGARASHHGIAAASIDGATAVDVDAYAAQRADNVLLWRASGLTSAQHVLTVTLTGRKNVASTGITFGVDRFVVGTSTCTTPAPIPDPTPPVVVPPPSTLDANGLLTRRGRQLYYNGQPYKSVGVNAFGLAGCETGSAYSDAQMDAFFGSLRPQGLTRAWAFQAQGIAGVDRLVHWAEVHNQLLILSFTDGRGYCAEADGRAGGEGSGKNESWYTSGYKQKYLPWLATVVDRFKNSKAIGMWELINEPGEATDAEMRAFFDDAAAHVKAIDKAHLVLSGSQAEYVRGTSDYAYVHGGPNIDVASLHEYDYDYNNGHTIVSPHLKPTLDAMRSIDKPLIVGETGISAGRDSGCASLNTRRDALRQKFDAYLAQDGVVGVVVWSWVPVERSGCSYEMSVNDPTMTMMKTY